jgi:hypothetical protein
MYAPGKMDWYLLQRLRYNLRRRSQRPYQLPEGVTCDILRRQLGLLSLWELSTQWQPAHASGDSFRKADAGNPHGRLDERAARRAFRHRGSLYTTQKPPGFRPRL